MKRLASLIVIVFLIIGSFIMMGRGFGGSDDTRNIEIRNRAGPRSISGIISVDTTWTAANSPYHIVDNTTLNSGVTLTIKAGVVVKFNNNTRFNIRGNLLVKGTNSNRVIFTNNSPRYKFTYNCGINGKDFSSNGTGVNYYIYIDRTNGGQADISFAKFKYSSDRPIVISVSGSKKIRITESIFSNNKKSLDGRAMIIDKCTFVDNKGGVIAHQSSIFNSTFQNNTVALSASEDVYIYNCTIIENGYGSLGYDGKLKFCKIADNEVGIRLTSSSIDIMKNSIIDNTIGVFLENSYNSNIVKNNNIYNNTDYNLKIGYLNFNALNNWWGTTSTSVIETYIYDIHDNVNYGEVTYKPFLTSPEDITFRLPVAKAGPDQLVPTRQAVEFNGSGSVDPEGNSLLYQWDYNDGSASSWTGNPIASHIYYQSGIYTVTLKIKYDEIFEDNDTCIVRVSTPPIPNAGPDQNVTVNQTVYFNGSGTYDPDGDTLAYNWDFGDGTSSNWQYNCNSSHIYTTPGNYTVTLFVTDGVGGWPSVNDTCIIHVSKENKTPPITDTDKDGLSDAEEVRFCTDPDNADSDDDGVLDGEEVLTYNTDPLNNDTDYDTISDYDEIFGTLGYITNPLNSDTDSDGIADNLEIYIYSTNPILSDTDSGGVDDYQEIFVNKTDPLDKNDDYNDSKPSKDTDNDGYPDNIDAFPDDDTQWNDTDGDGYGDNPHGNKADRFPNDPTEWNDADADGVGDNSDAYPYDPEKFQLKRKYYTIQITVQYGGRFYLQDAKFRLFDDNGIRIYMQTIEDANPYEITLGHDTGYPIPYNNSPVFENPTTGDGDIVDSESLDKPNVWENCIFAYLDIESDGYVNAGDMLRVYLDYDNDGINDIKPGYRFEVLNSKYNVVAIIELPNDIETWINIQIKLDDDDKPKDTDGDGIPDYWEIEFDLDPNDSQDAQEDPDEDGLTNLEEYLLGSNPVNKDSDGDGYDDYSDAFPTDKAAAIDTDNDGYPNAWNPGMSAKDSETGLHIDEFPNDPNKFTSVKEPNKARDVSYVFPVIVLVIMVIFILIMLKVVMIIIKAKHHSDEDKPSIDDKIYSQLMQEVLDKHRDAELSNEELRELLECKFLNGQMSRESYNYMKEFIETQENRKL